LRYVLHLIIRAIFISTSPTCLPLTLTTLEVGTGLERQTALDSRSSGIAERKGTS